jgi:biopolymer transport protein ExbB
MIVGRSLLDIFRESYTMQILLLVSILALGFVLERVVFYLRKKTDTDTLLKRFFTFVEAGKWIDAKTLLEEKDEPVRRVLRVGMENRDLPEEVLLDLMEAEIIKEKKNLTRSLTPLATLAAIAPLLGLYGTVVGLIRAFNDIAITGSGGPEVVGRGIAEALLTTAFGLIIAVPVLVFYNLFSKKAQDVVSLLEVSVREFLVRIKSRVMERE